MNSYYGKKNILADLDKIVLIPVIILIIIGIFSVLSASQQFETKFSLNNNLLIKKHIIFCVIGFIIILGISKLSIKEVIILSIILLSISLILSLAAILFFPETKGANRWVKFLGFSFQPSELLKPAFLITSALLLGRYKNKNDNSLWINYLLMFIISSILFFQPDFGMFILISFVWFIQVLSAQINKRVLAYTFLLFLCIMILGFLTLDHVKFRIKNFLLPGIGDNYQISKSLESFSNGGLMGKGIGNGYFSKNLPDAHSDFIFALIGEEMGFIIALFILILYMVIFLRIYLLCRKTRNFFVLTSLTGLSNILMFQTIINISTSLNLLPTKGMTLPFISYGGSSLISNSILIGFILVLIKSKNSNE